MPAKAARKQARPENNRAGLRARREGKPKHPTMTVRNKTHNGFTATPDDADDVDDIDAANKQLEFELRASASVGAMGQALSREDREDTVDAVSAAVWARLQDPPAFLAKEQESVDILRRARGRPAGRKLKGPEVVVEKTVKKRKSGNAVYDMSSEEEEEVKDEKPPSPAPRAVTPPRTRTKAQSTASPQNLRQTRQASNALQSPRVQRKPATWTRANDAHLLDLLDNGLPLNDIQDRMNQFTHDEVRDRVSLLYHKRKEEQAKEREAEEAEEAAQAKKVAGQVQRLKEARAAKSAKGMDTVNARVVRGDNNTNSGSGAQPRGRPRTVTVEQPAATTSEPKPRGRPPITHPWSRQEEDHLIHVWEGTGDDEWGKVQAEFPGRHLKELEKKYYQLEDQIQQRRRSRPDPDPRWPSEVAAQSIPDSEPPPTNGNKRRAVEDPGELQSPAKRVRIRGVATEEERVTPEGQKAGSRPPRSPPSTRTRTKAKSPELGHSDPVEEPGEVESDEEGEGEGEGEGEDGEQLPELAEVLARHEAPQTNGAEPEITDSEDGEEGVVHESIEGDERNTNGNGGVDNTLVSSGADVDQAQAEEANQSEDEHEDNESVLSDVATEPIDPADLLPTTLRLYGQTTLLNDIFSNVINLQRGETSTSAKHDFRNDFRKRDRTSSNAIKAIKLLTEKLDVLFDKLKRTSRVEDCQQAIDLRLQKLTALVSHLNVEALPDHLSQKRLARQVNLFTVTDLLSLLKAAIQSYATKQPRNVELKLWYLESWLTITNTLRNLYAKSRKWKNVEFYGVRYVQHKLLVPIQKVIKAFGAERRTLQGAVERATQQATQTTAVQTDQDLEEMEKMLVREWNDKYARLRGLFIYRQEVSRLRNPKVTKFRMGFKSEEVWRREVHPDHVQEDEDETEEQEFDADGEPIERVDVFDHRRRGRPPPPASASAHHDIMDSTPWSDSEKLALLEALQRFRGEDSFWRRVFYAYCLPGHVLAERTVPELLRMAEGFVDMYRVGREEADDDGFGEGGLKRSCPEFLRGVPDLDLIELLW